MRRIRTPPKPSLLINFNFNTKKNLLQRIIIYLVKIYRTTGRARYTYKMNKQIFSNTKLRMALENGLPFPFRSSEIFVLNGRRVDLLLVCIYVNLF